MSLKFPGFTKMNAYYIYKEVAERSGYLFVQPDCSWEGTESDFKYMVSFFEPFSKQSQCRSYIDIGSLSDIIALHELCQEMLEVKAKIEAGVITEGFKISKESDIFVFDMWINSEAFYSVEIKEDGTYGKKNGVKENTPNTHAINVSVLIDNRKVLVGRIGFSDGFKSAVLFAHDLDVVMALINNKPATEIIKIKPQTVVEKWSDEELVGLRKTTDFKIDWGSVRAREAKELGYIEDLKRQASEKTGQDA
jgi:hypothetical protein